MHDAPPSPEPPDDFDLWETTAIHRIVKWFALTRRLPVNLDANDLLQECFIRWDNARHTYRSSAGATRATYLERVVKRHLFSLQREWSAAKRGSGTVPLSLDQRIADEEGAPTLGDELEGESGASSDLSADLRSAATNLTARQKLVLKGLLQERSVAEIAQLVGVHRDTVNEELKRIRVVFEDVGLRDYLR